MERYDRHHILKNIGIEGQKKILKSSVLIVGVGGLGSPLALYLTAAGVGTIGIVDSDTVSVTNLQRQVLYTENEVGQSKVECAKKRMQALNSETVINTYNMRLDSSNARQIISNYDIVIDGCDNYETRYVIDDICAEFNKPYVYGAIGEFSGQVSVFNYEGSKRYRDLYSDKEELCAMPRRTIGVIGSVPGVIGTIQATEVIKIVVGSDNILKDRLFLINLLSMETQIINLGNVAKNGW